MYEYRKSGQRKDRPAYRLPRPARTGAPARAALTTRCAWLCTLIPPPGMSPPELISIAGGFGEGAGYPWSHTKEGSNG